MKGMWWRDGEGGRGTGLNTATFPDSSPLHKTLGLLTGHLGAILNGLAARSDLKNTVAFFKL